MPRCQWCRQDSQDDHVCDWCKRPLAAGWTPAAAAAVPAGRMTFQTAASDDSKSDKLLVFSMVGIVLLTLVAIAISRAGAKPLPSVAPAAAPIQSTPAPVQEMTDNAPSPAVVPNPSGGSEEARPRPPTFVEQQQPEIEQPPVEAPVVQDQTPVGNGGVPRNPKIAMAKDAVRPN